MLHLGKLSSWGGFLETCLCVAQVHGMTQSLTENGQQSTGGMAMTFIFSLLETQMSHREAPAVGWVRCREPGTNTDLKLKHCFAVSSHTIPEGSELSNLGAFKKVRSVASHVWQLVLHGSEIPPRPLFYCFVDHQNSFLNEKIQKLPPPVEEGQH